jgi:hypothetical protein
MPDDGLRKGRNLYHTRKGPTWTPCFVRRNKCVYTIRKTISTFQKKFLPPCLPTLNLDR